MTPNGHIFKNTTLDPFYIENFPVHNQKDKFFTGIFKFKNY